MKTTDAPKNPRKHFRIPHNEAFTAEVEISNLISHDEVFHSCPGSGVNNEKTNPEPLTIGNHEVGCERTGIAGVRVAF